MAKQQIPSDVLALLRSGATDLLLTDDSGSIVGTTSTSQGFKSGQTLYSPKETTNGNVKQWYSLYDAPTSIKMNDEGKVVISAPSPILEMDSFKEQFLNNSVLSQYASAYQSDPNYRVPDPSDANNGTTISIPEALEKWNDSLRELVRTKAAIDEYREMLARINPKAMNLSDADVVVAASAAVNKGDVKTSDSARQPIPEVVLNTTLGKKIKDLATWDPETQTVERGDLLANWFNLNVMKSEDVKSLMVTLETALTYGNFEGATYETDDGDEKNLYSTSEMAKAFALREFIAKQDLEGDLWQKIGDGTLHTMAMFAGGATEWFTGLAAAIETGAGFITGNLDNWNGLSQWNADTKESLEWMQELAGYESDALITIGGISRMGGYMAGIAAGSTVGSWAAEGLNTFSGYMAAKAVDAATTLKEAESLSAGAKAIATATLAAGKATTALNKLVNISKGLQVLGKSNEGLRIATTAIAFLADTVRDAMISDPATVRTILKGIQTGEVSQADFDYAVNRFTENARAWAIFRGAIPALKGALTKTTLGQAANLKLSQWITKVDLKMQKIDDSFKRAVTGRTVMEGLQAKAASLKPQSAAWNRIQNKIQQQRMNEVLNMAKEAFASGEWDGVLERLNKLKGVNIDTSDLSALKAYIKEASLVQNEIRAINNMIDNYQQYVLYKTMQMADPEIEFETGSSNVAIVRWLDDLANVEKAASGLTYGPKNTMMSLESANYMGYSIQLEHAKAVAESAEVTATHQAAAKRAIPRLEEKLEELNGQLSPEMTKVLDRGIELYRAEYAALNNYAKSNRNGPLVNLINRENMEDMDLWDDGYIRTQRVGDSTGAMMATQSGERVQSHDVTDYHYDFGVGRDYADFEQTRMRYRNEIAQAEHGKEMLQQYLIVGNATVANELSGGATQLVNQAAPAAKALHEDAAAAMKKPEVKFAPEKAVNAVPNKPLTKAQAQAVVSGLDSEQTKAILESLGFKRGSLFRGGSFKKIHIATPISQLDVFKQAEYYFRFTDQLNKNALAYLKKQGVKDFATLQEAWKSGTEFRLGLERAYLLGDEEFLKSGALRALANGIAADTADFAKELNVLSATRAVMDYEGKLGKLTPEQWLNATADYSNGYIDEMINTVMAKRGSKNFAQAVDGYISGTGDLQAYRETLEYIQAHPKAAHAQIVATVKKKLGSSKKLTANEVQKFTNELTGIFDATLEARLANVKAQLLEHGEASADIWEEVSRLKKQMTEAHKEIATSVQVADAPDTCLIEALDEQGRLVVYNVDPNLAGFYNRRNIVNTSDAGRLAKINYMMSKTFRLGTTTINLASFGRQLFKDTGNAIIVGGMWDTLKHNIEEFRDVFGDDVVEFIKKYDAYDYNNVVAQAQSLLDGGKLKEGATLADAMVEVVTNRETKLASMIAGSSSEVESYKKFRKMVYDGKEASLNTIGKMNQAVQGVIEKIDDKTNGFRETYLRKNVYMSNLNRWLGEGYDLNTARTAAEFAARNATTNFARSVYHLQSIAESTPYFAAAINGTKSFWRMFELDPVGITGRMMGGIVIPVMYLTAQSLADEESAAIYKNIPEYEKSGNFIFVIGGQVVSIPIPEQMASLVDPFRQMVEAMHGANKYTFWQLASNDLLGLSPYDLQGFSTIDLDRMSGDPTIFDIVGRGVSRVFSQMAPVAIKSGYMLLTGIDPYTGKKISDKTYYYYDEETQSVQMMDYTQNQFAKQMARLFGSDNPGLIEKVTSGLIGQTNTDTLGFLVGLVVSVSSTDYFGEQLFNDTLGTIAERAFGPFYVQTYDQTLAVWNRAVAQLSQEKDQLLNSEEIRQINNSIATATDPAAKRKLYAQRQNYYDEYAKKVKTTVERLVGEYGGTLDKSKYATVIALLNFNSSEIWMQPNAYSESLASDVYYEGREQAIRSMADMGIGGTTDFSMFGYYYKEKDGSISIRYYSPTEILNQQNIWYGASEINLANVKAVLEEGPNSLKSQRSDMYQMLSAAQTYEAKDRIREEWNEKVLRAIIPYLWSTSYQAAINNDDLMNYLEQYIQVPSSWEKVKNRYISSGYDPATGTYKLDKNKAFIQSYLRQVLKD